MTYNITKENLHNAEEKIQQLTQLADSYQVQIMTLRQEMENMNTSQSGSSKSVVGGGDLNQIRREFDGKIKQMREKYEGDIVALQNNLS